MTLDKINKIKLIHEQYDAYISKSKFTSTWNFRHCHIIDKNERDVSGKLFINFGVKYITSMGKSSAVWLMMFNISNVSLEN